MKRRTTMKRTAASVKAATPVVLVAVVCVLAAPGALWADPPVYNITDLGTLGGQDSRGLSLNDSAQVTGYACVTGQFGSVSAVAHAFRYSGGTMGDLGTLSGGMQSGGFGINSAGYVVGESWTTSDINNPGRHAILCDGTTMHDLGTLGGAQSGASAINASNNAAGWSDTTTANQYRAFLYDYSASSMTDLGALPTGSVSVAQGINDNDWVVGYSGVNSDANFHAFLHNGSTMADLGTLLGGPNSQAYAINNNGWVVGSSETPSSGTRPFLYANGSMIDLTPVGSGDTGEAFGINDDGDIVGSSFNLGGAFLYTGSTMYGLNMLLSPSASLSGWTLLEGLDINNSDEIICYGWDSTNNQYHALLLTPVPEPATVGVLGVGLAGLALRRKRK